MDNLYRAKLFATAAHAAIGQKRKYTGEPYIVHPVQVVLILTRYGENITDEQYMAAYLHDVVEDTQISLDLINLEFGSKVANLVYWLTDISKPEDGNREKRKELDRVHISKAPAEAKTIKLADLISNTSSITKHDPNFAKIYLKEKEKLLEVLVEGEKTLFNIAQSMLNEQKEMLNFF